MRNLPGGRLLKSQNQNQEDDFYSELDEKTQSSSCCTCQSMAILFILILIISVFFSVWAGREIKSVNWKFWQKYSVQDTQSINNKLKNTSGNSEIELIFTSKELTSLFGNGISNLFFEIKNPEFEITKEKILLTGKLTRPLKTDVNIDILPEVRNEKVYSKITKISANNVTLPSLLGGEVEKALNGLIDSQFKTVYDRYGITSVSLDTDKLIIKGKIKEDL